MPAEKLLLQAARFRVVERETKLATGETLPRQVVLHPGAVVILPLLAGDRVCLIRNYRIAVGKTLIELPAGTLEPGEPPLETARRELQEETGYVSNNWAEPWTEQPTFLMSPGILNERMYAYVATDLTPGQASREPGEEIDNLEVPLSKAIEMIKTGEIEDAKTIATLLYYQCFR